MEYRIYKDPEGGWRWTLVAENNRKIANSGEGYRRKKDCLDGIALVMWSSGAKIVSKKVSRKK